MSSKKESLEVRYLDDFLFNCTCQLRFGARAASLSELDQNLKFNEALHYMKSVGILIWITYLFIYSSSSSSSSRIVFDPNILKLTFTFSSVSLPFSSSLIDPTESRC